MFGFLYELLGGQHQELPRRRRDAPAIEFDGTTFVSVDGPDRDDGWLGRGEVPGQVRAAAVVNEGQTVADEMRALVATPPATRR